MTTWTRRSKLRQYVETSFWPIPAAYLIAAGVLGFGLPRLDQSLEQAVPAKFGVGAAQALLTAFATGLITVMGFIISVVLAGLTFTGTAVTPRIVREMQRSTIMQHVFGLLLFSVIYAFLVLNRVAPPSNPDYVPDLAVWLVMPLLVLDATGLLVLVRGMTHALRLIEIIDNIHRRAVDVINKMYPDDLPDDASVNDEAVTTGAPATTALTIRNRLRPGVVASIDVERLVAEAHRHGTCIALACPIGSYVSRGQPLLYVADGRPDIDEETLTRAVSFADERTIDQDPLYALRLIVDIATRALSPAVHDPTTAVQALDRIEDILSLLSSRRLDRGTIRDRQGHIRLVVPLPGCEDFLSVGVTEIRQYGATSTQVVRRLRAMLHQLTDGPPHRRRALNYELALLDQTVAAAFPDAAERAAALVADPQGLGEPGASHTSNGSPPPKLRPPHTPAGAP